MSKREVIRKERAALYREGIDLAEAVHYKKNDTDFGFEYQRRYTKAIKAVASLAPDRILEFRGYCEANPKR